LQIESSTEKLQIDVLLPLAPCGESVW
jgi:hypothetical protein